jgi:hypothetical protein
MKTQGQNSTMRTRLPQVLDDTGVLVLLPSVERDDIGALVVLAWLTSTGGGRERGSDG